MWQQKVLVALAAEGLEGCIQQRVKQAITESKLPTSQAIKERLWVLHLRESFANPSTLDRQVESWKKSENQPDYILKLLDLYQQLPHQLVKNHFDLIKAAAIALHKSTKIDNEYNFQDLLSAGQEALFIAANKFYLNPKGTFKNFAWNFLRSKMKEDQQLRHPIPARVRQQLRHLEIIREELRFRGEPASPSLLMQKLGINAAQLTDLLDVEAVWGSGADFETDLALEELDEEDESPSALALLIANEDRFRVEAAIERLPPRSKKIILEIYFADKSLRELAQELGVSINSMRKAHKKALIDLRNCLGPEEL